MAEYIGCRRCDSPYCDGCNIKTLEKMLHNGKFDCLMGDNRSINPTADVVEVRHGQWIDDSIPMHTGSYFKCSVCEGHDDQEYDYCHHCGAKMDGKGEGECINRLLK